jgi:hypothetical protein
MPSLKNIISAAVALAGFVAALPALPKLSGHAVRAFDLTRRQNAAAAKAGITDTDILQLYALTTFGLMPIYRSMPRLLQIYPTY